MHESEKATFITLTNNYAKYLLFTILTLYLGVNLNASVILSDNDFDVFNQTFDTIHTEKFIYT